MSSRKTQLVLLLTIVLALTGIAGSGTLNAAPSEEKWRSTWRVYGDFIGDKPNLSIVVTVQKKNQFGVWQHYAEQVRPLPCTADANVSFAGDRAEFDGTGDIECSMPSIRAMVRYMTKGQYTPASTCECKGNPQTFVSAYLDPNGSAADWANPIIHRTVDDHVDMELAMPIASGAGHRTSFHFTVDEITGISHDFFAKTVLNNLFAGFYYNNDVDLVAPGPQPGFLPNFYATDDTVAPVTGAVDTFLISYKASTLHIGHSPVTNQSFHGSLEAIDVDPGCYGHD